MKKIDKNKVKKFSELKTLIIAEVKDIRGEKDEEMKLIKRILNELGSSPAKEQLQKILNDACPKFSAPLKLDDVLPIDESMFSSCRGTHVYDVVQELIRATESAGFSFAKKEDLLYFGNGKYFKKLEDWEIEDFVLKDFFPIVNVDFKNRTVRGRDEVIHNLLAWVDRLDIDELKGK